MDRGIKAREFLRIVYPVRIQEYLPHRSRIELAVGIAMISA